MTKAEAILQALKSELIAGLPAVAIKRSRTSKIGLSEVPLINFKPTTDEGLNYAQGLTKQELTVEFDLHIAPHDEPDSAADPFIESLHQVIVRSSTLADLVENIQYKNRQWQFEDGDGSATKLTISYGFLYINFKYQL